LTTNITFKNLHSDQSQCACRL